MLGDLGSECLRQMVSLRACKMECSPRINIPGARVEACFADEPPSVTCSAVMQPCSPALRSEHPFGRAVAAQQQQQQHAPVLAGHKRACETSSCAAELSDEDEDGSMANSGAGSHTMCRSGSARTLSIKRVCSLASADALSPFSPPQQQQQHQLASLASCANLLHISGPGDNGGGLGSHAAAAAAAAAKRRSKTGSSSCASQGSLDLTAATTCQVEATPAAAGYGSTSSGRTALGGGGGARPGPRVRLGGRLLSPEEAARHLAAVAASAAAALAGRSLSRAPSPAVTATTTAGLTEGGAAAAGMAATARGAASVPACSVSMSGGGGYPHPGGLSGPGGCGGGDDSISSALLPAPLTSGWPHATVPAAAGSTGGTAAAGAAQAVCCALPGGDGDGGLPEDFIPTPDQVDGWHTLASTLDDDSGAGGAAHGGYSCRGGSGSPRLLCNSYTGLLLADEDADGANTAAAAPAFVSAFAPASSQAWLAPGAAAAGGSGAGAAPVSAAVRGPTGGAALPGYYGGGLSSSMPVAMGGAAAGGSGSVALWSTGGAGGLLRDSVSGSSSVGRCLPTLAVSLAPAGSQTLPATTAAGACGLPAATASAGCSAVDAELAQLLGHWAPQQQVLLAPVAVHGGSSSSSSLRSLAASGAAPHAPAGVSRWRPAFSSAFAPASAAAAAAAAPAAPAPGCGMMPTPGLPAPAEAAKVDPLLPPPQQPPQPLPTKLRIKTSLPAKPRRQPKQGGSKPRALLGLQEAAPPPQQPQQPQLLLPGAEAGGQQLLLSQEQLLAVMQQNMAASFASGYMLASSMQGQGQAQMPTQPAPPGSLSGACMSAVGQAGMPTAAAAVAAMTGGAAGTTGGAGLQLVDDILPSLQELLTDCV